MLLYMIWYMIQFKISFKALLFTHSSRLGVGFVWLPFISQLQNYYICPEAFSWVVQGQKSFNTRC